MYPFIIFQKIKTCVKMPLCVLYSIIKFHIYEKKKNLIFSHVIVNVFFSSSFKSV